MGSSQPAHGDALHGDAGVAGGDPTGAEEQRLADVEKDVRRPLSRKIPVPAGLLNPYRFAVLVRVGVMIVFFVFRVSNPNMDAYPLWLASVICEIWFGLSYLLDQAPKWSPVTRETYLQRLSLKFEPGDGAPCTLPHVDVFVSTADPSKEPPLVTANVILSVLSVNYPAHKIACYLSDDAASMLTFEALAETANFARYWVPFCHKHAIEPRAPEMYFSLAVDYLAGKVKHDFVRERRTMKRLYDEFKVRMNALVAKHEIPPLEGWQTPDGSPWPGNDRSDHVGMIQVLLQPEGESRDVRDNPLPYLVYVSREKRPGYDHNKKAGAMNALMRASGLITNGPFILNLDCDHYINNSNAVREAVCFLVDPVKGSRVCFVQFPQRFDGVDRSDRYANHNTVYYDINMKGLDGVQGPMYVGTGCVFRRQALYGFNPPPKEKGRGRGRGCCCLPWSHSYTPRDEDGVDGAVGTSKGTRRRWFGGRAKREGESGGESREQAHERERDTGGVTAVSVERESLSLTPDTDIECTEESSLTPTKWHVRHFGPCHNLVLSTLDTKGGRMASDNAKEVLSDVILVLSCGFEDSTQWGRSCGWMYGSVTEDIVTGYKMHTRGWHSIYCMPSRPAFKGSAPINLTDRLAQVLRWATGSVEIFFSSRNPIWADHCTELRMIQRLAYINTAVYPFTAVALTVYCLLPAVSLFTGEFIVPNITNWAVLYFLALFLSIFATAVLEIRWGGVTLEDWWRNEQFWVIGGTSAHLAAVVQGLLKVVAGIDIRFTLTTKAGTDSEDDMAELYAVRWSWLFLMPLTIIIVNSIAILAGLSRAMTSWDPTATSSLEPDSGYGLMAAGDKISSNTPVPLGRLMGQLFFAVWVLLHLYPFLKGLSGRGNKMPTLVILWAMLLAIMFSLIWSRIQF